MGILSTIFLISTYFLAYRVLFSVEVTNIWLKNGHFDLCSSYYLSGYCLSSHIPPKIKIQVDGNSLKQDISILIRCDMVATPYLYDMKLDIPMKLERQPFTISSYLPSCKHTSLYYNNYYLYIYIGNMEVEFTRRHFCPCDSQYVILTISCVYDFTNGVILKLIEPRKVTEFKGNINKYDNEILKYESREYENNKISIYSSLHNYGIIYIPSCIKENESLNCDLQLIFNIKFPNYMNINDIYDKEKVKDLNFCINLMEYYWKINKIQNISLAEMIPICINLDEFIYSMMNITNKRVNITLDHLYLENMIGKLINKNNNEIIENNGEHLKVKKLNMTGNNDISFKKLGILDKLENLFDEIYLEAEYLNKDNMKCKTNFCIQFLIILRNISPSRYFLFPNIIFRNKSYNNEIKYLIDFSYEINTRSLSKSIRTLSLPSLIPTHINTIPDEPLSDNKNIYINIGEPFYLVIPRISTNLLAINSYRLTLYISNKQILGLMKNKNTTLKIESIRYIGKYPDKFKLYNRNCDLNSCSDYNTILVSSYKNSSEIYGVIGRFNVPVDILLLNLPIIYMIRISLMTLSFISNYKNISAIVNNKVLFSNCNFNTCSGHGDCKVIEYNGSIDIFCSCYPGWGGLYCSNQYLSYYIIISYSVALIGTNIVAIPTIILCLYQQKFLGAFIAFSAGLLSSVFHASDIGLIKDVNYILLKGDLIAAQIMICYIFILLCKFNSKITNAIILYNNVSILLLIIYSTRILTTIIPITISISLYTICIIYWTITKYKTEKKLTKEVVFKSQDFEKIINTDNEVANEEIICSKHKTSFNLIFIRNSDKKTKTKFINRFKYIKNNIITFYKSFIIILNEKYHRPIFIGIGFIVAFTGCISWLLETVDTYWIWHSLWHICSFAASFLIIYGCGDSS
ncbi:uncharacterized protein CMU_037890 [Cryptosporidium muris RN66]|uniref:EGF-like domain-containing protein n=1 Tax=Cryptosporidium muris (strain RN66) TaxID=441375 RepID=B6A933_CRYMR|nr:uncharacterized protein CMU_037890 [Cryptosporidium muris RN66]EEA04724.1 hypothetical protein, conserved [Cryptosporidium muris RN66]|eukprot:XP_002139073.1 hypothetical protein [Cryptosporidium muris RN66]